MRRLTLWCTAAVAALAGALALTAPASAAGRACASVDSAGGVVIRGITVQGAGVQPPCRAPRQIAVAARNRLAYGNVLSWSQPLTGGTWACTGGRNDATGRASVQCRRGAARVDVRATTLAKA